MSVKAQSPAPQSELPLDHDAAIKVNLRWPWAQSGVAMPFEEAMRNNLVRRCLENVVHAANAKRRSA